MRILSKMRKQYAAYFAPAGMNEYGQPTYAAPVEIRVRWEDTAEIVETAPGQEKTSQAKIYSGDDLAVDGVLWKSGDGLSRGVLDELESESDPFANSGALRIIKFSKIPTLSAQQFARIAWV